MDLSKARARELDIFISQTLQPDEDFLDEMATAVDTICTFLKENCFKGTPTKVLKVVKGGSTGKGTTLKGKSDADLVVFLSCFKDFEDQEDNRKEIIDEIRRKLEAYKEDRGFTVTIEDSKWSNPRVLSFQLKLEDYQDVVECDVLPAYDALGHLIRGYRPDPGVYWKLLNACSKGGEFSTCFTELQRDFIKCRPTKVKSLIRLVKYWYKSHLESKPEIKKLPPKYALELLTIHAWEEDGGLPNFNTAEVFHKVLELVSNYATLRVYWLTYYDEIFVESQLRKPRPIIIDPADPTGNFGEGYCWAVIADTARLCMSQQCYAGFPCNHQLQWQLSGVQGTGSHWLQPSEECQWSGIQRTIRPNMPIYSKPPSFNLSITGENRFLRITSVNSRTKIQQIKETIQLEQGISAGSQSLFLGDEELLNHHTLADYGVFSSTTLNLKTQESYCTIL